MKVRFLSYLSLLIIILLSGTTVRSQHLDIAPIAGYFFDEKFPVVNGTVNMSGGSYFGGIVSYGASDLIDIELQYSHRNSQIVVDRESVPDSDFALTTNWVMINGTYNFDNGADAIPFLSVGMGWVHLNPEGEKNNSENRFGLDIGLGFKYSITDRFGVRLATNLLASMNSSSSFEGEGDEAYVVNKPTYVTQFGFRAGVYYRILDR
jgi:opacity protein-like surface antigen